MTHDTRIARFLMGSRLLPFVPMTRMPSEGLDHSEQADLRAHRSDGSLQVMFSHAGAASLDRPMICPHRWFHAPVQ